MYKRRINVRGIIINSDGKIFLQKLKNKTGINDFWSTPGGGLDDGEDILSGLHREMIEETGVAPVIGDLVYVQQFHDGEKEQLELFFHIKNADDYETLDLSSTSHGDIEVNEYGFFDPESTTMLPTAVAKLDFNAIIEGRANTVITTDLPGLVN